MQQRIAAAIALAGFLLAIIGLLVSGGVIGGGADAPARVSFQIATGATTGTFFPIGQAMAGLLSHPPGVGRCETATVCGPAGVIISARTSAGATANLRMVDQGQVNSGLVQGDVIAAAAAGRGPFRRGGPLRHVRVIGALFAEPVHLVVAVKSGIHGVADLRGKRVAFGSEETGTAITAREVLLAYRIPEYRVKLVRSDDSNDQLLREGKIDAYFAVAGVPLDPVTALIRAHLAILAPIDGPGRDRLVAMVPALAAASIPAGAYPGQPEIQTVSTRAYWVTRDGETDALIYGLARALFNPANRAALAASHPSAREIGLDNAGNESPAPLHPGAARYYREMGKL
jgi:TRAP transporter TAXI family solute receptor